MNDWLDAENHVERAREYFEAGRLDEAESELRQALARNPYQSEWHFNLGLTLEAAGKALDAAESFKEAYELDNECSQAALAAGSNLLRAGHAEDSIEWFGIGESSAPDDPTSYVHRIQAYSELGEHDKAELMFYMAQQMDPDCAPAYACMGEALLSRGLVERGVWCLREAARLEPGMAGVQARLARAYSMMGRHERARQLYLRELRADPGDLETLLELGRLLMTMNRPAEAGEKLRRVLEIEPDNPDAHFRLGELAAHEGRIGDALQSFDVVLRLDPDYPAARRCLAALLLERGRAPDGKIATELLRREVGATRREPALFTGEDLDELGCLLLRAKMAQEASRILKEALSREPDDSRIRHHLSVALFELGHLSEGITHAKRVLRTDDDFIPAMHNLALASMQMRRPHRARYWLRRAMRLDPDDASLRRLKVQLKLQGIGNLFRSLVGARRVA